MHEPVVIHQVGILLCPGSRVIEAGSPLGPTHRFGSIMVPGINILKWDLNQSESGSSFPQCLGRCCTSMHVLPGPALPWLSGFIAM